ncbi:hypothetical protein GCM10010313_37670 [Streptomyces violarus]|uniref:Uncharacterized protein n=1 Tax=Streptomyces violarus TaxID=67380 RepID=A0A7W5F5X3_9ACTN|nr:MULTISPECIES: hypothetical protein [Streptomyces]MBB3081242.1 hypothetical protein [Streptomyces violarus]WRU00347.1 hypothetical protein VJ737_22870 [Streptomyces sp. CGMCC 4.1772]GHD13157.1 hypothetical protein GCM10010313_37670 [Streptomyces violarus]
MDAPLDLLNSRPLVNVPALLAPGIVPLTRRRPDPADAGRTRDIDEFFAVTGKP